MRKIGYNTDVLLCLFAIACCTGEAQGRFLRPRDGRSTPPGRVGCFPSPSLGTNYLDPCDLGRHGYRSNLKEQGGIVYTCRGGHVDITHVRKAADWAAYLAYQSRRALLMNAHRFSYTMAEPSKYHVQIAYPKGWTLLPPDRRTDIAVKVANEMGQYFAFAGTTWHEILTWFGFKSIGFYSEFPSAFSWEDSYSNLLGTYLAGRAMADPNHEYAEAMTLLIDREMRFLQAQPSITAWRAGEAVRDWWFVGNFFFCDMVKRNFDIGADDGFITPWLVPGIDACEGQEPKSYPVPDLRAVEKYGFSVTLEVEPREWEKDKILRAIYRDPKTRRNRIEPARHFGPLLETIRAQAIKLYGPEVDKSGVAPAASVETSADDDSCGPQTDLELVHCVCACLESNTRRGNPVPDDPPDMSALAIFAFCWLMEEPSFAVARLREASVLQYAPPIPRRRSTGQRTCGN
ncbi:MAG: DUF4056 domain-containing protein [Sedimentisphaerales bacterium]|nr:DUF4056 domain-containing protein [Sedimentisphaerales bacterium]